jgi:hypothetical protein
MPVMTARRPGAGAVTPHDHQRLLQAVDSLGQRVEPRRLYRQMYRDFAWDPRAQPSPSIDIDREWRMVGAPTMASFRDLSEDRPSERCQHRRRAGVSMGNAPRAAGIRHAKALKTMSHDGRVDPQRKEPGQPDRVLDRLPGCRRVGLARKTIGATR